MVQGAAELPAILEEVEEADILAAKAVICLQDRQRALRMRSSQEGAAEPPMLARQPQVEWQ